LFEYVGGILHAEGCVLVGAGGMPDHVHLLVSMGRETSPAQAMCVVKANTSRWIHETVPTLPHFAWQVGYGAFSVSASYRERVQTYLVRQAEHHRTMTFEEEFLAFLKRHGVDFDERYVWE
jgi:REP element-mobilizing transposase RayT